MSMEQKNKKVELRKARKKAIKLQNLSSSKLTMAEALRRVSNGKD